jgi:hypothetical protein
MKLQVSMVLLLLLAHTRVSEQLLLAEHSSGLLLLQLSAPYIDPIMASLHGCTQALENDHIFVSSCMHSTDPTAARTSR